MKRLSIWCIIFALFLTGCATTQKLTALQRRTLEVRELEGTYEEAFKATMQVLQDNGFIIKSSDHASGVIQGETGVKGQFGYTNNREITATIEQFGANTVKERLTIIRKNKVTNAYGGVLEDSHITEEPEVFQKLYEEIQKEMFVRKNLNR